MLRSVMSQFEIDATARPVVFTVVANLRALRKLKLPRA